MLCKTTNAFTAEHVQLSCAGPILPGHVARESQRSLRPARNIGDAARVKHPLSITQCEPSLWNQNVEFNKPSANDTRTQAILSFPKTTRFCTKCTIHELTLHALRLLARMRALHSLPKATDTCPKVPNIKATERIPARQEPLASVNIFASVHLAWHGRSRLRSVQDASPRPPPTHTHTQRPLQMRRHASCRHRHQIPDFRPRRVFPQRIQGRFQFANLNSVKEPIVMVWLQIQVSRTPFHQSAYQIQAKNGIKSEDSLGETKQGTRIRA